MLEDALLELLALPRGAQPDAIEALLARLPEASDERWNTAFGPDSLFDAWTRSRVVQGLYAANAAVLRPLLDARPGWRIIEVGIGDGRLWERTLRPDDVGEIVLVDPVAEAHEVVRRRLPPGISVRSEVRRVEDAVLPDADALVCSLTLHHVAGIDAEQRASHGLSGPGKREVLEGFRAALTPRDGLGILTEADIHCEIDLLPGDPLLRDRLIDSYVRRCALALVHDLRAPHDATLTERWRAIVQRWCLAQVGAWAVPVADRDVYELDVGRWRALLGRAGLTVERVRCTDDYGLFYQYLLRAA